MATSYLKVGDKAPYFRLRNQEGKEASLSDFKGKLVVLYFYPKDNTPGCTIEAVDFTKLLPEFEKNGVVVLGVNSDSINSHCSFIEKQGLKITLLSDESKGVIKKYRVWQKKKFMGKEYMGIVRSTFVIDKSGKLLSAEYGVSAQGHAESVLDLVKSFVKNKK